MMVPKPNLTKIAGMATLHFLAFFAVFFVAYARGMVRFDRNEGPGAIDRLIELAVATLWFPMFQVGVAAQVRNNTAEWLLVFANSALWGVFLYYLGVAVKRLHRFGLTSRCS
jgi:hypothetical protein